MDPMYQNPGEGFNTNQHTFILMWNPAISSITIHNHIDSIAHIDDWEFNWSVYEWEKAHEGDRFYMVRVGEGNTGVVMSGIFLGCKRPENFCSVSWDKKVNSCSFAQGKVVLGTLDYKGVMEALGKVEWKYFSTFSQTTC